MNSAHSLQRGRRQQIAFMQKRFITAGFLIVVFSLAPLCVLFAGSDNGGDSRSRSTEGTPTYTLEQAVLLALRQNADVMRAREEIERTKGLYIEVRAGILPRVDVKGDWTDTDRRLSVDRGGPEVIGPSTSDFLTERSYNVRIEATQVIFAGGRIVSQIRSADFTRDASYYAFRNTVDQVVATTRVQFYQILLNRELVGVQEESVKLLKSQLEDQQNRFDAGTVPRFNVLQAQVALSNQYPILITAQNNYRIAQIQLAKTLGLNFDPRRADYPPLDATGELIYVPRRLPLARAIELAKERRPFLKQQKSLVMSDAEQVRVARSGYFPQFNATAAAAVRSSAFSDNIRNVSNGYIFGVTGNWAVWDWGATYGAVKQARSLLHQAQITYDDAGRQVELEVQQQYSNVKQSAELVKATQDSVAQAEEALRLASARLSAGAGTQLEVLDSRTQVTQAQSNRFQALFNYNASVAEFERVAALEVTYSNELDDPGTRKLLKTEAARLPAPKPPPLELNRAGIRTPVDTRANSRTSGGK
jgi:outer membrane protein